MENKKDSQKSDKIFDFGEEFGILSKQNISEVFVDIHASISPLDPLNKMDAQAPMVSE